MQVNRRKFQYSPNSGHDQFNLVAERAESGRVVVYVFETLSARLGNVDPVGVVFVVAGSEDLVLGDLALTADRVVEAPIFVKSLGARKGVDLATALAA